MHLSDIVSISNMFLNRFEVSQKRTKLISMPVNIALEPTIACNSDCIMCNRNYNRKETKQAESYLDWETFNKARPLFRYARSVLFGGFGEALLHPEYAAMLREIKKLSRFVFTYTNGISMSGEIGRQLVDVGIDRICISIGGSTRETYKKIRGVDKYNKVMDNIKEMRDYKRKKAVNKPDLFFELVAMNSVLPELDEIVDLAHELGVQTISMPNLVAQGEDMQKESVWLNIEEAKTTFAKTAERAKKYGIIFNPPNMDLNYRSNCGSLLNNMTINWDGTVMSCAREKYIIGDLNTSTAKEIWNSKGMIGLRKDYFERGLKHVCPQCTCWDNSPENYLNPPMNSREYATRL
jgi:radical SAM protein with 4Fe4S-binding SPASM domain